MAITAAQVKELRQRTGCGMMECKKALVEADSDMDAAAEALRKSGLAKADKKAGRVAAEGLIVVEVSGDGRNAAMVEVNSETDFVANKAEFQEFARAVAQRVLADAPADVDALMALPLTDGGETVEEARRGLIATIGENINVRRLVRRQAGKGALSSYLHGNRIGVLVEVEGGDADLARDVAMHIAASKPLCVDESGVSAEVLEKEKAIFSAQAEASGKPAEIIEKMVSGRIRKFLGEITLLGQPFVKDPDQTVGKLLKGAGAQVPGFDRLELGEGIEKKTENFADEVMAQVQGS
ncbi:MAG TPA: elongation factor Ts [Gammaproteobacteria bacterium]|nr:elongation factor Ts [Gammaproteobacteria bacterium]